MPVCEFNLLQTVVPLGAAVLAGVVAVWVSNRNIRAQVVSANRQRWVDGLRDELAQLHAGHYMVERYHGIMQGAHHQSREEFLKDRQNFHDALEAQGVRTAKLVLRLRKDDVLQRDLLEMVNKLARASGTDPDERAHPDRIIAKGVEVIEAELRKAEALK